MNAENINMNAENINMNVENINMNAENINMNAGVKTIRFTKSKMLNKQHGLKSYTPKDNLNHIDVQCL